MMDKEQPHIPSEDIIPGRDEMTAPVSAENKDNECSVEISGKPEKNARIVFKELLVCFLQVAVLTFIIINFVGRVSIVQGQSMYPSLTTDNRIIVNLFVYRFHKPERGEIIIFRCPRNAQKDYIKRVIGLPGEKIDIRDGKVFINDKELKEPYITCHLSHDENIEYQLEDNQVFVLGDNRVNSEDSRSWGPLDTKLIKGKAMMVFWPPESFSLLK